ncbi:hypothetical protein H4R99_006591 [Coemansia sp. RSA 1722]|nr:hypothetical protein H4R99_006591 [Coemansia sp. RSA 1722]
MTGILLESGMVLVPLACAVLYIVASSNWLLFLFSIGAVLSALAVKRLRYHYSSGAHSDLVVRSARAESQSNIPLKSSSGGTPSSASNKNSSTGNESSKDEEDFEEIVKDARQHCDVDDEVVEGSGTLLSDAVTTASTKYDMELYGSALSYDHRCFYIDGRPTWVLAADFDYWRIPIPLDGAFENQSSVEVESTDLAKRAWRRVLVQYKSMGFSAVRIRFHWGFHSPDKGKYNFTGNRDVHKLLTLCEELGLLVIACLGPYIGDDVQGGGYPFWLIQRDHIRLRHLKRSGIKVWDNRFAAAEAEWYDNIISMIVGHEVVTKNTRGRGCVLVVQLENHLESRGMLGLPLALQDETRLLARMARERIIRTPLVTNNLNWPGDFEPSASRAWAQVEKKLRSYRIIGDAYRADISGFSVCDIANNPVDIDSVSRVTRGDNSPMLALELYRQSALVSGDGSFSHQIESALSQGLTAFSLPRFFALPSWGNIASASATNCPDPQYAAVFEDGALSADARTSRLVLGIARAFEQQSAAADPIRTRPWITRTIRPAIRGVTIPTLPKDAVCVRRQWEYFERATVDGRRDDSVSDSPDSGYQLGVVTFVNGASLPSSLVSGELGFMFSLADAPMLSKEASFAMTGTLGPRKRGVFVSNIFVGPGSFDAGSLLLVAATKEIYARIALGPDSEVWLCAEESLQSGQLFFDGECRVDGHADVEYVDVEHARGRKFSFVVPNQGPGVITISSNNSCKVHVVLVSQQALDTMTAGYRSYGIEKANSSVSQKMQSGQASVAWGVDGLAVDQDGRLDLVAHSKDLGKERVFVISQTRPQLGSSMMSFAAEADMDMAYKGQEFLWQLELQAKGRQSEEGSVLSSVRGFEKRVTSWDTLPWRLLPTVSDLETMDDINVMSWQRDLGVFAYNAIDVGLNASHVLYRCQVKLKPQHITSSSILLQLNARHRCTIWVNGLNMSGHETFSKQQAPPGSFAALRQARSNPGSSQGPDKWDGTHTYDLTRVMRISSIPSASTLPSTQEEEEEGALNEVVVVVESYGLGTQSDGFNDARVPRGLIAAYWHGFSLIGEDHDDSEIHDHSHDERTEQLRTRWEICGVDVSKLSCPYNSSGFPDELATSGWSAAVEYPLVQENWSTRIKLNPDMGVHWLRWSLLAPNYHKEEDSSELPSAGADEPIYLRICGKVTAYVWLNGILLAKRRAEDDTESLVLLRGGVFGSAGLQSDKTEDRVVVMMYGWAEHVGITHSGGNVIPVDLSLTHRTSS